MQDPELGYLKGEVCNCDGCTGIIDEIEKEGGCSCEKRKAQDSMPLIIKTFADLDESGIDWIPRGQDTPPDKLEFIS